MDSTDGAAVTASRTRAGDVWALAVASAALFRRGKWKLKKV